MRIQNVTAAHRAVQLVRTLDTQLALILPQSDRVAPDSPEGIVWEALVGAVVQCTSKAAELTALSAPFVGTKRAAGSGDG